MEATKFSCSLMLSTLTLLLSFLTLTSSSSLRDKNICGNPQCDAPNNFKFLPESKYLYQYEAQVDTVFDVERKSPSNLKIKGKFQLQFATFCHGIIEVTELEMTNAINDSQEETNFLDAFSEYNLSFYFEDGKFREVCPDQAEPVWVLNFKKGILSALQNSMTRLDLDEHAMERDINGECITDYRLEAINGTTLVISKQKTLSTCHFRHQLLSILPTATYVFQTKYHKWSPIVSNLTCRQFVDNNIVTGVECSEHHSFLPFYNQSLGVSTSAFINISLEEEEVQFQSDYKHNENEIKSRSSLLYDTRRTSRATSGLQEMSALIVSLCHLNTEELQPEFSEVFNKLIHIARYLPYEDIYQLYTVSDSLCESGRKHMLDGLPHLRSAASIVVMKDILMKEKLPQAIVSQFLFSMSLFNRPEVGTIKEIAELVLSKDPDLPTYFTVSSLIHSYCQLEPSCRKDQSVQSIIAHWEKSVQISQFPENMLEMTVGVLKALGNAGVHTPSLITNLQRIIYRRDFPVELRVAAIDSHRRMKCGISKEFHLNIYQNQTYEEEVRIKAYLQVVRCPSHQDIQAIAETLSQEQSNQVGCFVWSHFQNLRISALPSLMEIQAMLQNTEFSSKFDKAYMKFSRNYQSSFYINEYGVGGFGVSNVVFSHESYIPRSVSSNITIILFGETINLAEVTLNLEGFEHYVETLFWKNGVMNKFEKSMNFLRYLRSSHTTIRTKFDSLPNVIGGSFAVPKASLSIRIFGNEIQYSRVSGHDGINSILNSLNPVKIIKDFLSGQEIKVEKGMLICDARYVTPLAVGLPLFTDAVITSTVKLHMAGFINATSFTGNGQFDLDGKLRPSIAINMVGSMGVDAYYKKAEVKVVSKIYTSTAVAGSFKLKGYKFAWISLNLPLKKSEIFRGNSELVVLKGNKEVAIQGLTVGRHETQLCSWPIIDDALGLTFCVWSLLPDKTMVLHSPLVIFNGPLNIEVTLDKSDPSTQIYTLEYLMSEMEDKTVLSLVFDTPGSKVKRGLNATINLDKEGPNVTLVFQTTRTQLRAQGFYRNSPNELSLSFWLDMNSKKYIDLQIALFIKPTKHGRTYEPRLQFIINSKRIAELSGSYKWIEKNELSQCEVNMQFKTNKFDTAITGYVRTNNVSLSTNLKLDYQFDSLKAEYVRLQVLFNDRSTKQYSKLSGSIQLESSSYRQVNTLVNLNFQRTYGHLDCKAVIRTNPSSSGDYKLMVKSELTFHRTHNGSKADILLETKKLDDDIDLKFVMGLQLAPGMLSIGSNIRYAEGKEITIVFSLVVPRGVLLLIEGNLRVTIPNTSEAMMIRALVQEKLPLDYIVDIAAVWFSGHNVTLRGSYEDKSTFSAAVHVVKLMVQSPLFKDIVIGGRLHVGDKDYKTDFTVDYNDVRYGGKIHHAALNPGVMVSNAELSINTSTYTVSNYLDLSQHQASMELHLDQYRDIHIKLSGPQSGADIKAMMDIKWDANRDPSQKLLFTIEAFKGKNVNYEMTSAIEYPGRTISASASLHHKDSDYTGLVRLDWGASSAFSISSFLILDYQKSGTISFSSTVLSPFENWKSTQIKYGLWVMESSMRSNGSVMWGHNGTALLDLAYDSLSKDTQVGFSLSALLNSTIKEVSPLRGLVTYTQSPNHAWVLLDVESSPEHRVRVETRGRVRKEPMFSEYSAFLKIKTPFNNLSSGELSGHFVMDGEKGFRGGSVISLNNRNITSSFEGSVKTINESKLMLTVYTPFQRYQKITGSFAFSVSKANLIAELKAPAFTLGLRTIYVFKNMQDFDLQLHAVTGVTFVNNLLLVGTINNETMDFRGGWNSLLVGMTARSHYRGWYDLEYRGSLFMPFEGFKENGAVAKFVFTDGLHLEVTAAVAKAKLGLKVVSEWNPKEDEDVSVGDHFCQWSSEGQNRSVVWQGLFELDTLYHPTASCHVQVTLIDHSVYATTGKLRLNIFDACLQDLLKIHIQNNLGLANDLMIHSSYPLLSELSSKIEVNGMWPLDTNVNMDLKVISNNNTYKFDMEGQYLYQLVGKIDNEGIYSVNYRLSTPFEALDHVFFDFNLQAEKFFFSSNLTIDVVDNRIRMDGTLEVDDDYFGLTADFNFASPSFSLPFCHLSFIKDFSGVEKAITLNMKYPNKNMEAENVEIGVLWHISGEQYIKLSGSIITPYEKLDDLHASFLYSSEPSDRQYNTEIFFKNSHHAELKLTGKTHKEKVYLLVESSIDKFRELMVNGTLKQQADGSFSLDAVVSTDHTVSMDVKMKSSQGAPLDMTLTMLENRRIHHYVETDVLVTVTVDLRRRRLPGAIGYDLITLVTKDDLTINLESDLTWKPTEENWNFVVTSNHEDYNEISLNVTVIPGKDEIFEISINGHTDTIALTCDFNVVCNMWFDGKKGRVKADLTSPPLSGDSYVEWEWDYLRNMRALANASYVLQNISKHFSSHLFLRSPAANFHDLCIGTDISLNNKLWWFLTNFTVMVPAVNDISFTSFLVLPHNVREIHSLVGQLHYTQDYSHINQMLKYSAKLSKMGLQTSVQFRMANGALDGTVLVEGGVSGIHFLRDNFNARIRNNQFDMQSQFISSFTKGDITVNLHYQKPELIHKITVDIHSPGHAVMVDAGADFEDINNMHSFINCTTPISNFPHIGVLVEAITNQHQYFRYGRLLWPNNTALFNYTNKRSPVSTGGSINDGILLVDFPLATRHTILFTHIYQENEKSVSGTAGLLYNDKSILQGNFSREQHISVLEHNDLIKVYVTNMYMPLGLKYHHKRERGAANPASEYTDKKRVEIFKAHNSTFNISGEINMKKTELDNTVDLKFMYSNRSLHLRGVVCSNNTLQSEAHVILKPSIWASSTFYLHSKHTETESSRDLRFTLSYPRRNLTVSGYYDWAIKGLTSHFALEPGSQSSPMAVSMSTNTPQRRAVLLLSHPALEKNVTLTIQVKQSEQIVIRIDAELEYAIMPSRKLSMSGMLLNRAKNNVKNYLLLITAKHPITRFQMQVDGALEKKSGYLFAFKNFSYSRSFLPLQYWNSSIKLDINNKEIQVQRHSLRDLAFIRTKFSHQGTKYNLEGNIIKGKTTNISGRGFIDFQNIKTSATVNLTSDASEQLRVAGDYQDNRHAFLDVWRQYDDLAINDVSLSLRLNHSRLLTSSYLWRTSIKQDFIDGIHTSCAHVWTYMVETADFWTDFMKTEVSDTVNEMWFDAESVLHDFIDDVTNVHLLKSDIVYFQAMFNESYEANEFYMQDIYNITLLLAEEIAFRDKMGDLPKIFSELWQVMGETGESMRQSILYLIDTIKNMYMKAVAVCSDLLQGNAMQYISQLFGKLSSKYDKMIKDLHVSFLNYVESLWFQMANTITDFWNRMLQVIEPAFIQFLHYVDSLFWDFCQKVLEFLYQKQTMILSSANLAKESNFTKDLDKFFKDVTKNGILSSFKKYTVMIFGIIKEKYFSVVPFGYELSEISSEIYQEVKELYKLPAISFAFEASVALYEKAVWVYEYFNVGDKVQQAIPFIYRKCLDISHTALENEIINHNRKTKFVFEPNRGELFLEQQLPMPWHSFNRIPNFEEIPEYKMITDAQKWLTPSNRTFWSLYYEYSPLADYHNWLPPYKGEAIIGRNLHFVTFDKQHFSLRSPCSYLLTKDFVRDDFSLVLSYTNGKHIISLFLGPYVVEIDLQSDTVSISGQNIQIPANLNGTLVFYEFGMITIDSDMGFSIQCNTVFDVCVLRLSGWYFGKTAGLLGTLDNEPITDWMMPNGIVATDQTQFTSSWLMDSEGKCASHLPAQKKQVNPSAVISCDNFFASKASQFSSCFPIVDPRPYNELCHRSLSDIDNELCTSAIMYIQQCLAYNIPLRTPNICVRCKLYSVAKNPMVEGDFIQIKGSSVPQSSDVVFIIEAKECNNFALHRTNMPSIVNTIARELQDLGLTNNRFAIVVFGGNDVFSEPRILMTATQEAFGSHKQITQLFSQVPIGNGNSDIFRALRYATKLKYRPAVSKTFILIPCSQCESNSTSFDYSALNEVLIEKDVTLHILMNGDFGLEKIRSNRLLYGVDSNTAYTKSDFKGLRGDKDLWRQVKVTRHLMGYCRMIALQSNGTLFSANKLDVPGSNTAKKFVSVFSKRVAASALPSDCQNCECSADENGIDNIDCVLCVYPTPTFIDFEINDNSSFFTPLDENFDYTDNDNL